LIPDIEKILLVAIFKMATTHHNLPKYEMALTLDNVEFVRYCGGHFENGDRQKFFDVGNQFGTS
jgi:hypothetical protein